MNDEKILEINKSQTLEQKDFKPTLVPTVKEISALSLTEKIGFRLTDKMNKGAWKSFWTFCQRHIGSLWIRRANDRRANFEINKDRASSGQQAAK
jgi:hypothetical protein